jgi:hypothetical protein
MRVFNFRRRKMGGIWFFKLGRLNFLLPLACLLREVTMMLSPHLAELLLRLFEREAIFLAMESDLSGDMPSSTFWSPIGCGASTR